MIISKRLWVVLALIVSWVLVVTWTVSSRADIITLTVTGTVAPLAWTGSGYVTSTVVDTKGVFGSAGASLAGDSFEARWTLDTASQSPVLSSMLSITGHTIEFGSVGYNVYQTYNGYSGSGIYTNITVTPGVTAMNTFIDTTSSFFSGGLTTPFSYTFNSEIDNLKRPHGLSGSFRYDGTAGYLNIENMTLDNPDYVGAQSFRTLSYSEVTAVPIAVVGSGLPSGIIAAILVWLCYSFRRRRFGGFGASLCQRTRSLLFGA